MNKSILTLPLLLVALGMLLPSLAYAHVGVGETSGLMHGLMHPVSGLDHVCAMLAVGLWAAQMGGRSVWAVPLTFVSVMVLGGALPMLNIGLPFVEQGIVLSVLLLGVLIAASIRLPLWLSSSLVGLFALWHGHAHGAEMPVLASGLAYVLGFVFVTALLHLIGVVFGIWNATTACAESCRRGRERVVHLAGASIALCGVCLAVA